MVLCHPMARALTSCTLRHRCPPLAALQVKGLSRADMMYVRTALGAPPRRLSDAYLRQERLSLHVHRERCRRAYEERTRQDPVAALPPGVPPQCAVGQQVVARHPVLRMLQDGAVLTVGPSTYMVQFHRSELGVGKVPDTDLAPADAMVWAPGQPVAEAESVAHEAAVDLSVHDYGAQVRARRPQMPCCMAADERHNSILACGGQGRELLSVARGRSPEWMAPAWC